MATGGQAAASGGPGWGLDRIDQRSLPLDSRFTPPADGAGVTVYLIDTGLGRRQPAVRRSGFLGHQSDRHRRHGLPGRGRREPRHLRRGDRRWCHYRVAKQAKLVEVQALGCSEGGSTMTLKQERRAVIRATSWIRRNAERPTVVNMSLAFGRNAGIDRAVRRLVRSGIPVIAAAGNQVRMPARNLRPAWPRSRWVPALNKTVRGRARTGVGAWTCGRRARESRLCWPIVGSSVIGT